MFYFLPVQSKTASIAGVVTLKGAPMRNVTVTLTPIESDGSWDQREVRRTKTDAGGRFQFKSLKAGNYVVAAMTPGYLIPNSDNVVHRGQPVAVAEGESLDDLTFEIVRGAVITGRVADAGGEPVAEEPITLWRLNDQGTPGIFDLTGMPNARATDDRGVYRLYGLPAGRYQVSVGQVQREGIIVTMPDRRMFYPVTFHPEATNASQAKIVEVNESDEAAGIDINIGRLRKTQDVFGRVVDDETGQPMAGQGVGSARFAGNPPRMTSMSRAVRTDAQGVFHLSSLVPGTYSIYVTRTRESEHYSEPVEVEVGDETLTSVEIRMRRGASVSGVVVVEIAGDRPASRDFSQVSLNLFPVSWARMRPIPGEAIRVTADGRFTVGGMQPGAYRFLVYGGPIGLQASLVRVERGGGAHPAEITLQPGEQATEVRVVIAYGSAAVRGQLRVVGGSLPEGTRLLVGATRADAGRVADSWSYIDPSGQFAIKGLFPGEYDVRLRLLDSNDHPQLAERLSKIKVRVSVEASRESQVTIPIDLGRKEGDQ